MKNLLFILLFSSLGLSQATAQNCYLSGHSNNENDSWLSCEKSPNPNVNLPDSYWLLYDLGYTYHIHNTWFWNFNVSGNTQKGMKNIRIDYSLDGINWLEASTFELQEASGQNDYIGEKGPNLGGIQARYILLSSANNWEDSNCAGLSEVRFEVEQISTNQHQQNHSLSVTIFPNPTNESLFIETDEAFDGKEIIIYDALGHEVMRMPFSTAIDIAHLSNGMYYLYLLKADKNIYAKHFIKQ